MHGLEICHRVRRAVRIDSMSERAAAIAFGIDRGTVSKMLEFSEPPRCPAAHACMRERGVSAEGAVTSKPDG